MSLGVLNNLNAIYASSNLNNTSNSLSKTLQQLSSGSKINSGADDAAGLSLVNGLQANATALSQSQTNASEGVGLLKVADGALSQVTNLLNRAVTLATEVSNGTLNGSQQTAANQEYQSILSEINNIGSTTTYNQKAVFGSTTDIYTGDSSTTGASIDSLNIRGLSSANVGDTAGTMSYGRVGTGTDVFIDLGSGTASTDALKNSTSTLDVSYMVGDTTATKTISVGGTTGYANSAQGMIDAINGSGLGLTASFSTDTVAGTGTTGNGGIMISGSVGAGSSPSSSSFSGVISAADTSAGADTISGSISFQVGNGPATTITTAQVATYAGVAEGAVTLDNLTSYINDNAGLGITASIPASGSTNAGDLVLSTTGSTDALKVTSNLTDTALASGTSVSESMNYKASAGYSVGITNTSGSTAVEDTGGSAASTITLGSAGSTGGIATISYSDKAGQDLSTSDLASQANAQSTLTKLNAAISNVAAQDGYIGAQINTLNAVSSVLSTQQQNVVAAQNAVQATDYAQAASDMSKYQILSQTGISALAQANSMQQEVTKLLQ